MPPSIVRPRPILPRTTPSTAGAYPAPGRCRRHSISSLARSLEGTAVFALNPVGLLVGIHGLRSTYPKVDGCGLLPRVGEPSDVGELRGQVAIAHEPVERAACFDRAQLCPVPDEDDLGAGVARLLGEGVQGEGAGQRCLANDDELPGSQRPLVHLR